MTDKQPSINEDFDFVRYETGEGYHVHETLRASDPSWRGITVHLPEGNYRYSIIRTDQFHDSQLMAFRVKDIELVRPEPGDRVAIRVIDESGRQLSIYLYGPDVMAKLHTAVEVAAEQIVEAQA